MRGRPSGSWGRKRRRPVAVPGRPTSQVVTLGMWQAIRSPPGSRRSRRVPNPGPSARLQIWHGIRPAQERWSSPGNSGCPEAPSLIFSAASGGRLYVGPLPTLANLHQWPSNVTFQISCMSKQPEECSVRIRGEGHKGIQLPGAMLLRLNLTNPDNREQDWNRTCKIAVKSLIAGETGVAHSKAGIHRGALGGALCWSAVHAGSATDAMRAVEAARAVEFH